MIAAAKYTPKTTETFCLPVLREMEPRGSFIMQQETTNQNNQGVHLRKDRTPWLFFWF